MAASKSGCVRASSARRHAFTWLHIVPAADTPHHFDGIQIRGVRRQEPDAGTGGSDQGDGLLVLVRREVIHEHEVAGTQCRAEHCAHLGLEDCRVGRSVNRHARGRTIHPDRGNHGGAPVAMRATRDQPFSPRRASAQAGHVRFGGRLLKEDELRGIEPTLLPAPAAPGLGDVGPILFGRMERLFLYVRSIAARA